MKTAREIIRWELDPSFCDEQAAAILAALAAEGFSIVETGRDPGTIEACAKVAETCPIECKLAVGHAAGAANAGHQITAAIRALSTRGAA